MPAGCRLNRTGPRVPTIKSGLTVSPLSVLLRALESGHHSNVVAYVLVAILSAQGVRTRAARKRWHGFAENQILNRATADEQKAT